MKRWLPPLILALLLSPLPAAARSKARPASPEEGAGFSEETVSVPLLGKVEVYRPRPLERARGVVLFVSGDGGWKLGVLGMAKRIAPEALVVGISMRAWQTEVEKHPDSCWYPAGELEAIAQAVEKIYKFPRYLRPILVGYSSGATVVYGAMAQGPVGSFAGAVSLGFCPDLEVRRPFCGRGAWKPSYDPKKHLTLLPVRSDFPSLSGGDPSWFVLQGTVDKVCDAGGTERFVKEVPGGKIFILPKVGHGFGVTRNWGDAFDTSVAALLEPQGAWEPWHGVEPSRAPNLAPDEINRRLDALDLPLAVTWPESASDALIFVSGDGGWMELDQEIASRLHDKGVAVIGWSTLRYFWKAQPPARFRQDLDRIVATLPESMPIYAGGYSFGAEVVPVTLASAPSPDPLLGRIRGLVLVGPGRYATYEVSPLDWIFTSSLPTEHPVRAALEKMNQMPILCLESAGSAESGCPQKPRPGLQRVQLPGSHHFGGDYATLAEKIAQFMGSAREDAPRDDRTP
jgi:type IV secretory pathway VirJ component